MAAFAGAYVKSNFIRAFTGLPAGPADADL